MTPDPRGAPVAANAATKHGFGLGQREAQEKVWKDTRDARYSMRPYLAYVSGSPEKKVWKRGVILDQGEESSCVGMAGAAFLNCEPVRPRAENQCKEPYATALYSLSKNNDEWDGTDYEGTSTRALAKVLTLEKWIDTEYVWADNDAQIRAWVLNFGPVIFSSTWTSGMFYPDHGGYVWPRGTDEGGHAYVIIGWDQYDTAICQQSWGEGWGQDGIFRLTREARAALYNLGYYSALTVPQLSYYDSNRRRKAGVVSYV